MLSKGPNRRRVIFCFPCAIQPVGWLGPVRTLAVRVEREEPLAIAIYGVIRGNRRAAFISLGNSIRPDALFCNPTGRNQSIMKLSIISGLRPAFTTESRPNSAPSDHAMFRFHDASIVRLPNLGHSPQVEDLAAFEAALLPELSRSTIAP